MIKTYIEFLTPEDAMLRVEGFEDYEIFLKSEWLPKGSRIGDMVEIEFEINPKIRKYSNLYYMPQCYEYEPND